MFKFEEIKRDYGVETLQKIRIHEKLPRKIGRQTSHIRFNLQCKHTNLTPKNVKLKSPINTPEAKTIVQKAERALLDLRIVENNQK